MGTLSKFMDKKYITIPTILLILSAVLFFIYPNSFNLPVNNGSVKGTSTTTKISIGQTSTSIPKTSTTYNTDTFANNLTAYKHADRNETNYSGSIQTYEVGIKSGPFKPVPGIEDNLRKMIENTTLKRIHVFIQFDHVPLREDRKKLENMNITLFGYFQGNTYQASLPVNKIYEIAEDPYVLWIGAILRRDKADSETLRDDFNIWTLNTNGTVNISVEFFEDISLSDAENLIITKYNGTVTNSVYAINSISLIIKKNMVSQLLDEDYVNYLHQHGPPASDELYFSRGLVGVDEIQIEPYNLDGDNVRIMQYEDGNPFSTHPDLSGRTFLVENITVTDHATHVAGIIIGNGSINNSLRGMAPKGMLFSYILSGVGYDTYGDIESNYNNSLFNNDIVIASNSWGIPVDSTSNCSHHGDYESNSRLFDEIIIGKYGKLVTIIFSAGNQRIKDCGNNYSTINPPKSAKNIIAIGNINANDYSITSSSSWGPTDDGRIKPDIVAPGCRNDGVDEDGIISTNNSINLPYFKMCGTSMAAPHVSGTAALMIQQYRITYGNGAYDNITPFPSSTKAILMHTAKDLNNTGPDYTTGYGLINATKAVDFIIDKAFIESNITPENETDEYDLSVSPSDEEIKVTIVWDDYPAAALASKTLINDLDLILISPNGTYFYTWTLDPSNPDFSAIRNISDHVNNVEQVYVNSSEIVLGTWKVKVNGSISTNSDQNYSLVGPFTLKISDLTEVYSNDTQKIFRFVVTNNHPFNLSNINWTMDLGEQKIYANQNITLQSAESAFVYFEYNFTNRDFYNITATATSGNLSDAATLTVPVGNLIVTNLSVIYANSTERIFRFVVFNNNPTDLTNLNWSLDDGESGSVNATTLYSLAKGEPIFIYFQNNYSSGGNYSVSATSWNSDVLDSKTINITV
jgi:hypothetical protein